MKEVIYEKAVNMLSESNTLSLSVIDVDNCPKIYPMEKVISHKLNKILFITKKDSNKVYLLGINNKCCVEVHTEDDSVSLKGTIEINQNEEEKCRILPYEYLQRLTRSGSDKYCVLIFKTLEANIYINGETERIATDKVEVLS
ncbi:MAG: pyridoxamine 5'-phosphate oxidase family protein [Clostridium sp.]